MLDLLRPNLKNLSSGLNLSRGSNSLNSDTGFINLKINLIFSLYPEKCIKFNQLEWRIQSPKQQISSREFESLRAI